MFSKNIDINTEDDKGDERIFQNPTYEETSATQQLTFSSVGSPDQQEQENLPEVMYDTVKLPSSQVETENGKTYDVLNRGQTNGTYNVMLARIIIEEVHATYSYSTLAFFLRCSGKVW